MARRILKRPPPFLFRYRRPSEVTSGYLEGLLKENHIWASPPRSFEDHYDCFAQIDFAGSKSDWLRYLSRLYKELGLKGKAKSLRAHEAIATGAWKNPSRHAEVR